ncbi:MAG: metallophosphoesterase family protein [Planctomycetaceae bacterium]|nr:metallophosphoesterase family protein [Planctomycetaceae bacterium]
MKIGILSDIHGDLVSLQKALTLFELHAVDSVLCAGDVVEKGRNDDEVVSLLRELGVPCVQGNHDENAIRHQELSREFKVPGEVPLKSETIEYLKSLPRVIEQNIAGTKILLTHGTPSQNAGRVFHEDGSQRLSKSFKKDLARTDCEIVVVGHTHSPFDVRYREKRVINPGATCDLKGRDSHTVGILDLPGGLFTVFELKTATPCEILECDVT